MKFLNEKPTKNKILFCQHNNIFSSISWEWIIPQIFLPSFYAFFSSHAFSFFLKANSLKQEMHLFPGLNWIIVFLSMVLT